MITRRAFLSALPAGFVVAKTAAQAHIEDVSTEQITVIAEDAFIYGLPLVMNYGIYYEYFIDKTAAAYKAPFNQLYNTARVYTPQDTTVVTPNSDTPYSFVCMDLRAEPFVFCAPEIEKARYFSVQLIDMYTPTSGTSGAARQAMALGAS